jgi:hypothetical protein
MERGLSTLWVRCSQCERVDTLTEPTAFILIRAAGLLQRPCPGRIVGGECGSLERLVKMLPAASPSNQTCGDLVLDQEPVTEGAYGHATRHRERS